jgi:hypothetical protein
LGDVPEVFTIDPDLLHKRMRFPAFAEFTGRDTDMGSKRSCEALLRIVAGVDRDLDNPLFAAQESLHGPA